MPVRPADQRDTRPIRIRIFCDDQHTGTSCGRWESRTRRGNGHGRTRTDRGACGHFRQGACSGTSVVRCMTNASRINVACRTICLRAGPCPSRSPRDAQRRWSCERPDSTRGSPRRVRCVVPLDAVPLASATRSR
jgi:hypothetical protein